MQRIGILFIIRKYRKHQDGTSPIYVRITISDRNFEMSCKHTILPERWNQAAQKADGKCEQTRRINVYLKSLEQDIYKAHQQLIREGNQVSIELLRNKLNGKKEPLRISIQLSIMQRSWIGR
jgi:hypothetical protein